MKNKVASLVIGLLAIAIGVGYGMRALGYIDDFTIFIPGWWTVFIIVPGLISLFNRGSNKFVSLCIIAVGVLLFLSQQNIFADYLKKLLIPAIIIIFGLSLILNSFFGGSPKKQQLIDPVITNDGSIPAYEVSFGEVSPNYFGKQFEGCSMDITFGSGKLDLRNAIIDRDVAISINTAFSGVDVILPPGCRVDVHTSTSFAGVENKYLSADDPNAPLVQIYVSVSFGGVNIK